MIERRKWHWVDWMLFTVMTGWAALGFLYAITDPQVFGTVPWWGVIGGIFVGYCCMLIFWRPGYINFTWFPVAVLLTIGSLQLVIVHSTGKNVGVLLCPLILVGFLFHRKTLWWTVPVFLLGYPLANFLIFQADKSVSAFMEDILNHAIVFGIGLSLGKMLRSNEKMEQLLAENQRQYYLIQQQNKALEQYASRVEELTLLTERSRMARELHDTVGHTFTSVIMGMDAVAYLIESAPDKAKEKLEKLRSITRSGLEEVRRSIHQLAPQDDDLNLSEQLSRLANEFAVQTGTRIRIETYGQEYEVPKQTRLTLFRCLQEALTNAKRHGQASVIEIRLTFEPQRLELRIEDDGVGSDDLQSGFGLSAMKERIAALQGMLHVKSAAGQGTVVTCTIPVGL
jgi:signal transduction histidine kinase